MLSFDSSNENNEWSLNLCVIKKLRKFFVAAIKKSVYEWSVATMINEAIFLSVNTKELRKDTLAIESTVSLFTVTRKEIVWK